MSAVFGRIHSFRNGVILRRLFSGARGGLAAPSLCWLILCLGLLFAGQSQAVSIIVNPSVPAAELSTRELRAIYTMRLDRWANGDEIQVFVLPKQSPIHQQFSKKVLQALPHQLQAVWYRLVYSGMGRAPTEVQDEQEMLERVSQTPGAIGYLENADEVSGVQVVDVERLH